MTEEMLVSQAAPLSGYWRIALKCDIAISPVATLCRSTLICAWMLCAYYVTLPFGTETLE